MKYTDNPFYILKASTRDRKSRLNELADEAAFHGDHDIAINARNILSSPRTRIAPEVAWFPGLSPRRIGLYLEQIESGKSPDLDGLSGLCAANIQFELLRLSTNRSPKWLQDGIQKLADYIEEINLDYVTLAINEDRQAAGLPVISDATIVESEITERIKFYERTITTMLDSLPSKAMVSIYEGLVSQSTNYGEDAGHRLIDSLIDSYELKASDFLSEESEKIKKHIDRVKKAADHGVTEAQIRVSVNEIINSMRTWDAVAQPIQLAYKSRGLSHDESQSLAFAARGLGVHLFNKHDYLDVAKLMSEAIQELFYEVSSVIDQVDADLEALDDIATERVQRQRSDLQSKAQFEKEITYQTEFGIIFKDKFRISPAGFDYKGTLIPLEQITGVRWGSVRNTRNGIYTGTDYYFGYAARARSIELTPDEHQYQQIIQKAWRAVCVRILLEWMESWRSGNIVNIAGVEITDLGVNLKKTHFFKNDEFKFFPWHEISKGAHNGYLNLSGTKDRKFSASFSYKDGWNVHILDFALDKIWEGKANKLSEIFRD